ncbi:hypothetical protein [Abyssibacter profundi]|uniref:Multidrug transporter n=1 Tax=Abyssibacter profundi TaxID=2182787 RepID=A0A363UKP2_9GAMM|nr:hypothetical protein [Abyssibacter profundi]MBV62228.1 hypothetical protein [Nevskiales bacterium]PWN55989.1 hypothetical protein DEH80_09210 [Abyssibacter profundi]
MRRVTAIVFATVLGLSATVATAASSASPYEEPTAGAMAFDLLIVRPIGLVTTVAGAGLFVLSVPFSAIQGKSPLDAADTLVVEPARFTFTRPLGVDE